MALLLSDKENGYSIQKKLVCWSIHLYTALGGIAGIFALIFASRGDFREAFLLLILQMVIDATDGMLARRLGVSKVLPNFDGAEMDNVIDIFTYAWIPIFIIYQLDILPTQWLLVVPVIAKTNTLAAKLIEEYVFYTLGLKASSFFLLTLILWSI